MGDSMARIAVRLPYTADSIRKCCRHSEIESGMGAGERSVGCEGKHCKNEIRKCDGRIFIWVNKKWLGIKSDEFN